MITMLGPGGMLDASAIAYRDDEPVGIVFAIPSDTSGVILKPGRELAGDEKLNTMAIGVRENARGQGIAAAMASYAFLKLAQMGVTHVAYPLVLDDNWASRLVGERLGGIVRANWMTYRRNFKH